MSRFNQPAIIKPVQSFAQTVSQAVAVMTVLFGGAVILTACSHDEHHEVHAIDKVEEASALAREKAPEAEVLDLEVAQAPKADDAQSEEVTQEQDVTEEKTDSEADTGTETDTETQTATDTKASEESMETAEAEASDESQADTDAEKATE